MDKTLYDRLMGVDPGTIGHYITGGFMDPRIKPVRRDSKMCGPAYTVRMEGNDSAPLHLALRQAPKGSVIVIDRCGETLHTPIGDMVALFAQVQGFAGLVIDGPVTDSRGIEKLDIPVFCTGFTPAITKILGITGETQVNVVCGGAPVRPGDIVFGDADGVVVLDPETVEEPLKKAEANIAREPALREKLLSGGLLTVDIFKLLDADVPGYIADAKKK